MPYKSKLSIWCQKNRVEYPLYKISKHIGPSHAPIFPRITCEIFGNTYILNGQFKSKKEAEEDIAKSILRKIKKNDNKILPTKSIEIIIDINGNDKKEKNSIDKLSRNIEQINIQDVPENTPKNESINIHENIPENIIGNISNNIYLIDFDNSANIKDRLNTINGEIHIFISFGFNEKSIPNFNGTIHKAFSPTPEMVDHMITWFSCKNLDRFIDKEVIIISRDTGLNALREILHNEKIRVQFKANL